MSFVTCPVEVEEVDHAKGVYIRKQEVMLEVDVEGRIHGQEPFMVSMGRSGPGTVAGKFD